MYVERNQSTQSPDCHRTRTSGRREVEWVPHLNALSVDTSCRPRRGTAELPTVITVDAADESEWRERVRSKCAFPGASENATPSDANLTRRHAPRQSTQEATESPRASHRHLRGGHHRRHGRQGEASASFPLKFKSTQQHAFFSFLFFLLHCVFIQASSRDPSRAPSPSKPTPRRGMLCCASRRTLDRST